MLKRIEEELRLEAENLRKLRGKKKSVMREQFLES